MDFADINFLLYFLPFFFLIYALAPHRGKNAVLFLGSAAFYLLCERELLLVLPASICVNYLFGRLIGMEKEKGRSGRGFFVLAVLINVTALGIFKLQGERMPLGFSFYTFQAISYLADIFQREIEAEKSFGRFSLYLGMFPKLASGPITPYKDLEGALKERRMEAEGFQEGLRQFALGLVFKVLLADHMGVIWHDVGVAGFESITWRYAWLGAFSYSLKLYFDFYGYSLMAVGLGGMLGFALPENFRTPYLARSVRDFYRRWHITLGQWFRKYVYIPLGGSRSGEVRTVLNLLAVWALTGLWHGGTLNFILWGLFLWCCIVFERLAERLSFVKKWKVLPHLYLWFVIPISWMFFAITDPAELKIFLQRMFGIGEVVNGNIRDWLLALERYGWILAGGVLGASGLVERAYRRWKESFWFQLVLAVLFWVCVWIVMRRGSNPFQYISF